MSLYSDTNNDEKKFQILSLDGGGIRGLFSAAILAAIEQDLSTNIVDHFDLITGTSTGGIIAVALGMGMRPREIVDFYIQEGPKIFSNKFGIKNLQQWYTRKYSQKYLVNALKECFNERKFGESIKRLVIPAYNIGEDDVYIFRTPHSKRLRRDYKVPAWKVALATSSAPTFFPCCNCVNNIRLIDGGVWANNPSMVGIIEAIGTLKIDMSLLNILSIGTTDSVTQRHGRLNNGGIIAWALNNAAVNIIMRGQSIGVNNQITFLLGKDRVLRLDPKVVAGEFTLDKIIKSSDLIGKAAHYSRIYMPNIERNFMNHFADPYIPIYT